jgi:formylmethanofuran dehydrogenase subunit E
VAQIGEVMLVGVPACAIYYQTTVFDLVLPRLLAGEQLTRKDIAALGPGGLCLDCKICDYPDCSFGKH